MCSTSALDRRDVLAEAKELEMSPCFDVRGVESSSACEVLLAT